MIKVELADNILLKNIEPPYEKRHGVWDTNDEPDKIRTIWVQENGNIKIVLVNKASNNTHTLFVQDWHNYVSPTGDEPRRPNMAVIITGHTPRTVYETKRVSIKNDKNQHLMWVTCRRGKLTKPLE